MSKDFTVVDYGPDTSGRRIYLTRYAINVWEAVLASPEVAPFADKIVTVQGAFMLRNGGGAAESAGYHNLAGCWDIRTWNLTKREIDILIRELRKAGIAAWRRDPSDLHGGMDEHVHVTFGDDSPLSSGAAASWSSYVNGGNGLANNARDYEWRPSPLVLRPPKALLEGNDMADAKTQAQLDRIEKLAKDTNNDLAKFRTNEVNRDREELELSSKRYKALVTKIGGLADRFEGEARAAVLKILAEETDVTGVDNPA